MSTKKLGWLVGARDGKKLGSGWDSVNSIPILSQPGPFQTFAHDTQLFLYLPLKKLCDIQWKVYPFDLEWIYLLGGANSLPLSNWYIFIVFPLLCLKIEKCTFGAHFFYKPLEFILFHCFYLVNIGLYPNFTEYWA